MTAAPIGCLDGEQAIRDALAFFPKGWQEAFGHVQEQDPGIAEVGVRDSDGFFGEVISVDTGNYSRPEDALPLAKYIAACNPETMRALLAELDRLRSASRQEGWQPIDTAPRLNGRRVLLLRDGGNGPFHSIGYALDGLPGWCSNECRGIETLEELGYRVTHWMPLPAAPRQSQEAQGDRHEPL